MRYGGTVLDTQDVKALKRESVRRLEFARFAAWLLGRIDDGDDVCLTGECEHKTLAECNERLAREFCNSE